MFIMWNVITIPMRMAFHQFWANHAASVGFLFVDYVGDLMFAVDIALNFVTPFNEEGFFVTDAKLIVYALACSLARSHCARTLSPLAPRSLASR